MLEQLAHLLSLSDTPRYNIKAVVQQTQVNISTLRAWEQRYGVPHPKRSEHGHRLYSQRDIAIVKWLKQCTDDGLAISQAVQMLCDSDLLHTTSAPTPQPAPAIAAGWSQLRAQVLEALLAANIRQAHMLINTACTLHPVERVIFDLFEPLLAVVGERWERAQLSVAEEHLVSNFIRQRLLAFSQLYAPFAHGPRLICGCAPNEQHETGLLMFAMLMEQRGWEVIYLGQNLSTEGLSDMIAHVTPALFCVTVTMTEHIPHLLDVAREVSRFDRRHLQFTYAGRAFERHPELQSGLPGVFLGCDLQHAVQRIESLAENIDRERWLSVVDREYRASALAFSGARSGY